VVRQARQHRVRLAQSLPQRGVVGNIEEAALKREVTTFSRIETHDLKAGAHQQMRDQLPDLAQPENGDALDPHRPIVRRFGVAVYRKLTLSELGW